MRRPLDQAVVIESERIEEEALQRQLLAQRLNVELAAKAAHGDLERLRAPVRAKRDRLAVQDQAACRQRPDRLDHLRHRAGHLVELAREHPDLVLAFVHLDAGAIELPLEGRLAEPGERVLGIFGRLREHRLKRPEQLHGKACETGRPFAQSGPCDHPEIAREHRRAAHIAGRQLRRLGHRLDHHALERALAQFADQEAEEEILLRLGRPGKQLAQQPQPFARRPLALDRHEPIERRIELAEGQAGAGRRRLGPRLTQGRMADPDPALARQPREQADRDFRRLRTGCAQTVREMADLGQPPARLGHPRRGLHDLVQPHGHGHAAASRSRQNGEFSEGGRRCPRCRIFRTARRREPWRPKTASRRPGSDGTP